MQFQAGHTKESAFNDLMAKYPKAMRQFCQWLNAYKEAVKWKLLFHEGATGYKPGSAFKHTLIAPKYHELPYALQLGIWIEFLTQNYPELGWSVDSGYNLKKGMEEAFAEIEKQLKQL